MLQTDAGVENFSLKNSAYMTSDILLTVYVTFKYKNIPYAASNTPSPYILQDILGSRQSNVSKELSKVPRSH